MDAEAIGIDRHLVISLEEELTLRNVVQSDLPIFFAQQLDPIANQNACFHIPRSFKQRGFHDSLVQILSDKSVNVKTVLHGEQIVGHVASYVDFGFGKPEVTYWIGKEYWGKGIATKALSKFLELTNVRPIFGRAARDNIGSLRVLEKCGFKMYGKDSAYSNVRGEQVEELIFKLD
jgi:RimJ/RimL family protein N-acetyltransferase